MIFSLEILVGCLIFLVVIFACLSCYSAGRIMGMKIVMEIVKEGFESFHKTLEDCDKKKG